MTEETCVPELLIDAGGCVYGVKYSHIFSANKRRLLKKTALILVPGDRVVFRNPAGVKLKCTIKPVVNMKRGNEDESDGRDSASSPKRSRAESADNSKTLVNGGGHFVVSRR